MYYAVKDGEKETAVGTGPNSVTEITQSEYEQILSEVREKVRFANAFYNGEIEEKDIPEEWREEILKRVAERKEWDAFYPDEALNAARIDTLENEVLKIKDGF